MSSSNLLTTQGQGFEPLLNGTLTCPDASTAPDANFIWKCNNATLRTFIQSHVSPTDVHFVWPLATAHLMSEKLRSQHEQRGAFAQINLLIKALQIDFTYEKPTFLLK